MSMYYINALEGNPLANAMVEPNSGMMELVYIKVNGRSIKPFPLCQNSRVVNCELSNLIVFKGNLV